jgi:hypothetical protein
MLLLSRFTKASESRYVRFVRDDTNERAPWLVVGSMPDRELAELGALLAGPEIDRDALRELGQDDALIQLLERRDLPREKRDAQLQELLAKCPRTRFLPPIDLDVSEQGTRSDALLWAARLDPELERVGLGRAGWHTTGGRAGIHGDLEAPHAFSDPDLIEIARVLVLEAARAIGIPLLSDHPEKEGRAPVVLDDRLFRRNPGSRGLVWRLTGALKPKSGGVKTPINLAGEEVEYARPVPGEIAAFERAATIVARQRELEGRSYGRARARRQRPAVPLALPASKSCLTHFADELARLLEGRTGANHEARMGCSGWLLRLGVAPSIVEATIARGTGVQSVPDPRAREDAHDAVVSTARRLDAGLPAKGLPFLQIFFGGAACVELRAALERDGVAAARKSYWTDHERRLLMRLSREVAQDHPGRLALRDGGRCGTFSMPYECEEHGPQGARVNVEERELTCPHCREARLAARLEIMREVFLKPSYGVLVVPCDVANPDRMRALRAARHAGQRVLWRDRRWYLGDDHVLLVFAQHDVKGLRDRVARLTKSEVHKGKDKKARAAALAHAILPEHIREVSRDELLEMFARTWRQPGVAFQGLVEIGDAERVKAFPWLQKRNVVRTAADRIGREAFPWPTNEAIRERAKAKAIAARGGIDPTLCDAETGVDEIGCPIPCCKPYRVHVDHLPTGQRLRSDPYVGRFPRNHELHLLLELADPDVLREGYEQQRALARRR